LSGFGSQSKQQALRRASIEELTIEELREEKREHPERRGQLVRVRLTVCFCLVLLEVYSSY